MSTRRSSSVFDAEPGVVVASTLEQTVGEQPPHVTMVASQRALIDEL